VGGGWYLDPNPHDLTDFEDTFTSPPNKQTNAFVGLTTNGTDHGNYLDLYSTVVHELCHALGLNATSPLFKAAAHLVDGNPADMQNLDPMGNSTGNYWAVETANVHALFTSSDTFADAGGPAHFAEPGAVATYNGRTYLGANALMNSRDVLNGRKLIDDTLALILHDVYGFDVNLPSSIANFYDTLDADGTLRIDLTSLGGSDDLVTLSASNGFVRVQINLGDGIPGIDPAQSTNHSPSAM